VMFEYSVGSTVLATWASSSLGRRSKNLIVSNAMTGWRVATRSTHWKGYTESARPIDRSVNWCEGLTSTMAPEMRCALTTFSARSGRSSIPFLARGRSSPVVMAHTGPTGCVSQVIFSQVGSQRVIARVHVGWGGRR
jgi:hypothetical protein